MACCRETQEGDGWSEKFPQTEPPDTTTPVDIYQLFMQLMRRRVVIAVAAGIENQRHKAAADQQRKHHAAGNGHIAIGRDGYAAEMVPGADGKPYRQGENPKQSEDEECPHGVDIRCIVAVVSAGS